VHNYEPLKQIKATTLETGRTYLTPLGPLPSITTILGKTANAPWLQAWKDRVGEEEAARISKLATDRGELVHAYLERHWNGENIFPHLLKETSDVQHMVRNLVEYTIKGVTEVWAQEIAVYSKLGFAGRLDKVGKWKNIPSIIDYKTSKKKKAAKDIKDYYIQCAAYAEAHNELFGTNITNAVILITVESGPVQEFSISTKPFIPELKYRIAQYNKLSKV